MANSPVYLPADRLPRVTSADVTAGQVLAVSGVNTVAATSAATSAVIGVAASDVASGGTVVVYTKGVHVLTSSGTITAGDLVVAGAAGIVVTQPTPSAANDVQVVGLALDTAASNKVTVLLR